MNSITRGMRNAFRNVTRTTALVAIIGLSLGLALSMLIANQAVGKKIASVESSVGNTITIAPAGFQQGSQNNNALTTDELDKVEALAHVSSVAETLTDRLSTTGSTSFGGFGGQSDDSSSSTTSLESPTTFNSDGPRFRMGGFSASSDDSSDSATTTSFSFPVSFLGTTDPTAVDGTALTLKSGSAISGTDDTDDVLISQAMATKNSLKVGSTFTAYDTTLTVAGIFTTSSGNQNVANTVLLSLPALQRLTGQSGVVTSAVVTVDSLNNLSAVTTKVKDTLGSSADITSAEEQAETTVKPLKNIQTISVYSLIGAIAAGAVIIFMTMIMIVRERRREIGVIKAIGASDTKVTLQFMSEAVTLTVLAAVVGIILGVLAASPITNMLVSNSSSTSNSQTIGIRNGPMISSGDAPTAAGGTLPTTVGTRSFGDRTFGGAARSVSHISTQVGWDIIAYGFGAAIVIAVVGSGVASFFIARIRPAEVMRVE